MDEIEVEKIIELVRAKEVLWNLSDTNYKNNKFKAVQWKAISNELNMPIANVKTKWRSIRDTYARNLTKRGGVEQTTEDCEIGYKYAAQLKFLRPHLRHRSSNKSYYAVSKEEPQINFQDLVSVSETQDSCQSYSSNSTNDTENLENSSVTTPKAKKVPKKLKNKNSQEDYKSLLSTVKTVGDLVREPHKPTIIMHQIPIQNAEKEDELFCRSLVQKMAKFPVNIRNSTKFEMLRFLNEVEEKWLDTQTQEDPLNIFSTSKINDFNPSTPK